MHKRSFHKDGASEGIAIMRAFMGVAQLAWGSLGFGHRGKVVGACFMELYVRG